MRYLTLLLPACAGLSPYAPLPATLPPSLAALATETGPHELTLRDGRVVSVDVFEGAEIQAFGELEAPSADGAVTPVPGLCGRWEPGRQRISVVAFSPRCHDFEAALLHEVCHALGYAHTLSGVMRHDYSGPVSLTDSQKQCSN